MADSTNNKTVKNELTLCKLSGDGGAAGLGQEGLEPSCFPGSLCCHWLQGLNSTVRRKQVSQAIEAKPLQTTAEPTVKSYEHRVSFLLCNYEEIRS